MTDIEAIEIIEFPDLSLSDEKRTKKLIEAIQQLINSGTLSKMQYQYKVTAEFLVQQKLCYYVQDCKGQV